MTTFVSGSPAGFTVTVMIDGQPVELSGVVNLRITSEDGRTTYVGERPVAQTFGPPATWPTGQVFVQLTAAETALVPVGGAMLTLTGEFGIKRFRVLSESIEPTSRTSLFIKDIAVDDMRRESLMMAMSGALPDVALTDNYLWTKLMAAESEIAHTLRVPLVPTMFFPYKPSPEQIEALDGMAWGIDHPYDYDPDMFKYDEWAYTVTRQRPIIKIERLRFSYPTQDGGYADIPNDWLRVDRRIGHIRIVPTSPALFMSASTFVLATMTGSRSIPSMMQLTYSAGLEDAATEYPELVDIIKKKAVLKILSDAFLPQSGSLSADGLSESVSVDASKYEEIIDHTLNGASGSNGGLMAKIHGIRAVVI